MCVRTYVSVIAFLSFSFVTFDFAIAVPLVYSIFIAVVVFLILLCHNFFHFNQYCLDTV